MYDKLLHAARSDAVYEAALAYGQAGLSVIPLQGKRPALASWKQFQTTAATPDIIDAWHKAGLLNNVGIICGEVSGKLVVLDLDGLAAYAAFTALFPELAETFTVKTGSGQGYHVYWLVDDLPESIKAMDTPIGNLEICASGRQVVVPPSAHPDSGQPYTVEKELEVKQVDDIDAVLEWIESFKTVSVQPATPPGRWQPPRDLPAGDTTLNLEVVGAIARHFEGEGYKRYGDWLHGRCIYPQRHINGDRNPSFGFNTNSGYGHCYRCGTILAKDICAEVGIRPDDYGGLVQSERPIIRLQSSDEDNDTVEVEEESLVTPSIADLTLPDWLSQYMDWAGSTGNQTPLSFHLAAGLWLLSTAIGRRLYGEAPWGVKLYPNLYLMLIAGTTYYRKSTAYKLAERIARDAIPHMLMPTPGSPERFQEALSGRLPSNFDKLSTIQQERFKKAQPFAAQRGLLKDEVAGLFSAMKRDYMSGMKDLLMELYDCPDYSDKDTQAGLTIVENAALSILGVTTPAGLSASVTDVDWANGLLSRFALLTPEPNYMERPAPKAYLDPPPMLIEGLRTLHERLPMPETTKEGLSRPCALKADVQCWAACQDYGNHLRQLGNPEADDELDERLKGVYGRLHVQAFKVAQLMATLDWCDTDQPVPIITEKHWQTGRDIAELWRLSAHRLLAMLDQRGDAHREQTLQRRMLDAFKSGGRLGRKLRDVYRNLHIPAKQARQIAQDLERAGLVLQVELDGAEAYVLRSFMSPAM
ncbi:MAG: bifunctional DNA primase/polymerase [Chloroflexi bacterium]|nr:bifunctional DNA primase/polymerase [Chloroflexota bacterium]